MVTTMTTDEAAAALNAAIDEHKGKPLPLGLHFDLPMDTGYLADHGLGSGDIKLCANDPFAYWWGSWMNGLREDEEDTPARQFGRALHKCVLEGREWFEAHYMRGPDQKNLSPGKKGASTRAFNELAASHGKEGLKAKDYDYILLASGIIRSNPDLAVAFTGGMPEVSFFWMEGETRMKMRIDYLKVRITQGKHVAGVGDLKSLGSDWRTDDFEQACYNAIDDWSYHVQAAHYLEGMRHVRAAIEEGLVYVHDETRRPAVDALLERLLKATIVGWQWVFISKPGSAPRVHSMFLREGNQFLVEGRGIRQRGIDNYRDWMKRKGPNELWTEPSPVREAEFERMRHRGP